MSQSRNPTDTQALLQSMLQRLKLQPGKEGQVYLQAPASNTAASTWGQDGERATPDLQGANSSPVNGFEFGTSGITSKELSAHKPGHAYEVGRGDISSPTHKENSDSDPGEIRVLGQNAQISTGTEQLLPEKSLKDVGISSSERTDEGSFGSAMISPSLRDKDAVTSTKQGQGFTPRVYAWSLQPADRHINTGSNEDEVLHMGNGGFEATGMQVVPAGKTNSLTRRQQRAAGNKTRRWTQKIKERWRERQGSLGKKGKGEGDDKTEQRTSILPENKLTTAETLTNTSNKEEVTPPSLDGQISSAHTEDGTNEAFMRSTGDFEFGLGSFSLLDEIVTGQEWAKFLNPNSSANSDYQRPPEELQIPQNHHHTVITNQYGDENKQLATADSDVSMAQTSSGFVPVSMDVSGIKQQRDVHSEADQSEPMEHGNSQSEQQAEERGQRQRPALFLRPADLLDNSALKSRVQLNRKRQHQSAGSKDLSFQMERTEISVSSENGTMKETKEESHHSIQPLYNLNSPQPLSPSAAPPKGVLKHSISQDSESSMEVETKRRRVEENRRVRFSEEVQTIPPPELDLELSGSEEDDSGADEDSVIEQECDKEQTAMEQVAPTRRAALPAWILALKRKNTGRKNR
ncbi:uncharacterized protein zgc:113229 [Cheilinus undulatus]|uniref:uncharacterized protein zgc:113229 n=1 Tax=Cheilinus undulatus TaxID=241271 RepID=UPI001BD27A46|nr:uncharacterized protein zgc:113229 [Cheilinus undulatus]